MPQGPNAAAIRQEQLAELIKQAVSQPGLSEVIELAKQDWFRMASTFDTQAPLVERVGVSTDTVTSLF